MPPENTSGQSATRTAVILVGICFLLNLLSRGSGETFTTFLLTLTAEFQANRADVAGIYSLQMLLAGLCAPVAASVSAVPPLSSAMHRIPPCWRAGSRVAPCRAR